MRSIIDVPALVVGILVAVVVAAALLWAHRRDDHRRGWITAGVVVLLIAALAALDLSRESPRETNFTTPLFAGAIATLATVGMVRATRRVPMWLRAILAFVTAFVMLMGGLLMAASYFGKLLPF